MTQPSKQTILQSTANGPGKFEGTIVWWGLTDSVVPYDDFAKRWEEAGLDKTLLPAERTAHRNLTDAVKTALVGVDGVLVRPIVRAGVFGDVSKLAIVSEARDVVNDKVDHHQECVITLKTYPHPTEPNVVVKEFAVSRSHPLADRIKDEWERLEGSYTASEIRRAIVNVMGSLSAVVVREHGGVYWVPPNHAGKIDALKGVIDGTGFSQFDVLPLFATGIGTETIAKAASKSIADEIVALEAEIAKFREEAPRGGTLERRLAQYDDLRSKARLYRDVLALDISGLEQGIVDLESAVDSLLAGPTPALPGTSVAAAVAP